MPPRSPHIVLIMADHLRRDCLSCYGHLPVNTPHLDALSAEGLVFERAYCSTPLCVPTRVSMYTGQWPHTNGVLVNGGSFEKEKPYATLGLEHPTLYEQLDCAGYGITHVGIEHCHSLPPLQTRVPRARIQDGWNTWERVMQEHGKNVQGRLVPEHRRPCPDFEDGKPVVKHFKPPGGGRGRRRQLISHIDDKIT
ncbi:MAG: sulfatase-like hydrolase/transferase [Verrucomicrobia bacterium]|nr:sulfatase-like hydrolase/transferase [Verrucomicrobiota bacterium]